MSSLHPVSGRKWARCFQALPENVSYCVACGFDNGQLNNATRNVMIDSELQWRKDNKALRTQWPWLAWLLSKFRPLG